MVSGSGNRVLCVYSTAQGGPRRPLASAPRSLLESGGEITRGCVHVQNVSQDSARTVARGRTVEPGPAEEASVKPCWPAVFQSGVSALRVSLTSSVAAFETREPVFRA